MKESTINTIIVCITVLMLWIAVRLTINEYQITALQDKVTIEKLKHNHVLELIVIDRKGNK